MLCTYRGVHIHGTRVRSCWAKEIVNDKCRHAEESHNDYALITRTSIKAYILGVQDQSIDENYIA